MSGIWTVLEFITSGAYLLENRVSDYIGDVKGYAWDYTKISAHRVADFAFSEEFNKSVRKVYIGNTAYRC